MLSLQSAGEQPPLPACVVGLYRAAALPPAPNPPRLAHPPGRPAAPLPPRRRAPPPAAAGGLSAGVRAGAAAVEARPASEAAYERELPLGDTTVRISVEVSPGGDQTVRVTTPLSGRLLLHWGVEGGAGYKGGWRLPGPGCRPEGTVAYKQRALQTPFCPAGGGDGNGNGAAVQGVTIQLAGSEASDYLNFVVKEETSGTWYDCAGSNFHIPLRPKLVAALQSAAGAASRSGLPALLPPESVPQLPQELCGIWAYIKWEAAGCPNRSREEADREYQEAIQEMVLLLRRQAPLDELWEVARGHIKYADYMATHRQLLTLEEPAPPAPAPAPAAPAPAAPPPPPQQQQQPPPQQQQQQPMPQDLIGIQAYVLWEQAGKPDGADFGDAARRKLEDWARSGASWDDIRRELTTPKQAPAPAAPPPPRAAAPAAAAAPPPPPPPPPAVVGQSIGMRRRNPLDLVNLATAPLLSEKHRPAPPTPLGALYKAAGADESAVWYRLYNLGAGNELLATVAQADTSDPDSPITVSLTTTLPCEAVLHWGVKEAGRKRGEWLRPPPALLPEGSELLEGGIAAETPFRECPQEECPVEDWMLVSHNDLPLPIQRTTLQLPRGHGLAALTFVIRSTDGTAWWRDGSGNFVIPVPGPRHREDAKRVPGGQRARAAARGAAPETPCQRQRLWARPIARPPGGPLCFTRRDPSAGFEDELSRTIVDCEVNSGAWTLMHRFNKAADLLSEVTQEWVRLMLTTVGRGGNAQAVRDEILNIMHRNRIKEVKGTWMEEWHQKLHNNTTPDDVPICEAYLAFLHANGDQGEYWRVLSDAGITRARLESFERPIRCDPEHFPDKRDALISEFQNYLKILKAVHSGADLQASASAAAGQIPDSAKGYLGYVLGHAGDSAILPLIEAAVEARTELAPVLRSSRETLYLDLALENVVRGVAERSAGAGGTAAAAFVGPLLQNLALSTGDNEEICYCLQAWQELPAPVWRGQHPSKDEALRAMAVIDRIRRALADVSDHVTRVIGPVSHAFGRAFDCEDWAVALFPEEVVRGGPAFAVSLVLSSIEPGMRAAAELGAWQLISPATCVGRLEVVPDLHGIQERVFEEPTILLARRVTGEEEVPVGVVGLLSGDAPDVLSHLAVRSRNMHVLFATCYEPKQLESIARMKGKQLAFDTTAAGAVKWHEADAAEAAAAAGADAGGARRLALSVRIPPWCGKWVVGMDAYAPDVVGAKSKNLASLRGRLPSSIALPASVTVPFGAFEEALKRKENKKLAGELAAAVKAVTPQNAGETLARCRDLAMQVTVPKELVEALRAAKQEAGIPLPSSPERWDMALQARGGSRAAALRRGRLRALKAVWASKYNERAFVSTRKVGISFDDVRMAVLCQRVVPARYAFVIHTTNPTTGDEGEIYCELVKGLGEAIVSGTVPGTALAFVARKDDIDNPKVLLYPSKSEGMFVPESLIFRSDSNGEDLQGYAGAGLYDSVTMDETVRRKVDYSTNPLLCDEAFRRRLMADVCRTGLAIEQALGSPQDVEGVVDPDLRITVVQTRPQM
eukprot:scaffold2.g7269.t1